MRKPRFPRRGAAEPAPAHSPRSHCATLGEPETAGGGWAEAETRTPRRLPPARRHRPRLPGSTCGQRASHPGRCFRRCGPGGHGARVRVPGWGAAQTETPGHWMDQKSALSEARAAAAAAGAGTPRPPGRPQRAATRGRRRVAAGAGARRCSPCTSCSRTRPSRPALPDWSMPGPAPAVPSLSPARGAAQGRSGRPALPSPRAAACPLAGARALSRAQAPLRDCCRLRLLFPSSRLALKEDEQRSRLGLVYSAAGDYIYLQSSHSPDFPLGRRHRRAVFQITVFNCTCLSDYLWESVGGAERV